MLFFIICYSGFDSILSQYRAVDLDRRKRKFLCNRRILNRCCLVERTTFDPFRNERTASNRRSATVSLKFSICDNSILYLYLKSKNIALSRKLGHRLNRSQLAPSPLRRIFRHFVGSRSAEEPVCYKP